MAELPPLEAEMLERLRANGALHWVSVKAQEVRALNRLVRKGYASRGGDSHLYPAWYPLPEPPEVSK